MSPNSTIWPYLSCFELIRPVLNIPANICGVLSGLDTPGTSRDLLWPPSWGTPPLA